MLTQDVTYKPNPTVSGFWQIPLPSNMHQAMQGIIASIIYVMLEKIQMGLSILGTVTIPMFYFLTGMLSL